MKLNRARMCVNCEEIFTGTTVCPRCGSKDWIMLVRWLKSLGQLSANVDLPENIKGGPAVGRFRLLGRKGVKAA